MRKIKLLAFSDIKKNKGQALMLGLMIMLAAMFLNLGLYIYTGFNSFFDSKVEELNTPHISAVMAKNMYEDEFDAYVENYPGVKQMNKEEILFFPAAEFIYGEGKYSNNVIIIKVDESRLLPKFSIVEIENGILEEEAIFVPYVLKSGGGYQLGDDFSITIQGQDYSYKIGGFIEDVLFGGLNSGVMALYLPDSAYTKLSSDLHDFGGVILSASFDSSDDAKLFAYDFQIRLNPALGGVYSPFARVQELDSIKFARSITLHIGALLIVAAAAIMSIVTLAVIKSRISNNIEEDMCGIGTLKALGYTSKQIMTSIIIRFLVIALASCLIGCILSYLAAIPTASVLSAQTGLKWMLGIDYIITLISIFIIILTVVLVTYLSTMSINRISPVKAFGGRITSKGISKNRVQLKKSRVSLIPSLALKNISTSLRHYLMLAFVLTLVGFATVFSLTLLYNISINNRTFLNMVGGEPCDVILTVNQGNNSTELADKISQIDHVQKVISFDMAGVIAGQTVTAAFATDNYNDLTNQQVYEGRYPKTYKEAAIGGMLAHELGKRIGDRIEIYSGEEKNEYIITGFSQGTNYGGKEIYLTYEGLELIVPGFVRSTLYLYTDETLSGATLIQELNTLYTQDLAMVVDYNSMADSILGAYSSLVSSLVSVIFVVIVVISGLILAIVVSSAIVRDKMMLGIQKSLGFTTLQLMMQIALSFLPSVIVGVAIGGLLGTIFTNPLLSMLFSTMGIKKTGFAVPIFMVLFSCFMLGLICYGVAMYSARRTRKITPCALIAG